MAELNDTIHVMPARETTSEAMGNYGAAVLMLGVGACFLGNAVAVVVREFRRREDAHIQDLVEPFIKDLREGVEKAASTQGKRIGETGRAVGETVRGIHNSISSGSSFEQVVFEKPRKYYVKKSYTLPVADGDMVPVTELVELAEDISPEDLGKVENVKFESLGLTQVVKGHGPDLVHVSKLL